MSAARAREVRLNKPYIDKWYNSLLARRAWTRRVHRAYRKGPHLWARTHNQCILCGTTKFAHLRRKYSI